VTAEHRPPQPPRPPGDDAGAVRRRWRGPRRVPRGHDLTPTPSRETALNVLLAAERSGRFVSDVAHRQIAETPLSPADRALVSELVHGVVRRRATLDAVVAAYSDTRLWRLDSRLLWVLRLAVYQMLFLTRIPPRAAVDEAVKLARRIGLGWLTAFANGLLRNVGRGLTPAGPLADRVAGPRHVIPIDTERTIVSARAVLPHPEKDLTAFLAAAYSYPEWLVARWLARFEDAAARALLAAGNERLPLHLRVNRLRTTRDELIARLTAAGLQARPSELPDAIELAAPHQAVTDLPGFAEGLFYVQDLTAMQAAPRLRPQAGERLLDLCAAPGGKTTHLAELMGNQGAIVASDASPDRLAQVEENAQRLGVTIITTVPPDQVAGEFDAVLLDAPCTNTGVLARRAEARWRLSDEALAAAVDQQRHLLDAAAARVRPGGRLLYSTCSIEPEEDRAQIDAFFARHPDFALLEDDLFLPTPTHDGGYLALLGRTI
jgi:16S rRNA (cytosine967-C5)-methyltransferase